MEVGETLSKLFKSESSKGLEGQAFERVVDIRSADNPVLTHTTETEKLGEILREGLISREFGQRIKKPGYEDIVMDDSEGRMPLHRVIMFYVGPIVREGTGKNNEVGILVRPVAGSIFAKSGEPIEDIRQIYYEGTVVAKNRIAPSEFQGFLLSGKNRNLKGTVVKAMRRRGLVLPIYTPAGDLLWPKQMSHEEIVRMLAERQQQKTEQSGSK